MNRAELIFLIQGELEESMTCTASFSTMRPILPSDCPYDFLSLSELDEESINSMCVGTTCTECYRKAVRDDVVDKYLDYNEEDITVDSDSFEKLFQ